MGARHLLMVACLVLVGVQLYVSYGVVKEGNSTGLLDTVNGVFLYGVYYNFSFRVYKIYTILGGVNNRFANSLAGIFVTS